MFGVFLDKSNDTFRDLFWIRGAQEVLSAFDDVQPRVWRACEELDFFLCIWHRIHHVFGSLKVCCQYMPHPRSVCLGLKSNRNLSLTRYLHVERIER